jgi:hypothetical protein
MKIDNQECKHIAILDGVNEGSPLDTEVLVSGLSSRIDFDMLHVIDKL